MNLAGSVQIGSLYDPGMASRFCGAFHIITAALADVAGTMSRATMARRGGALATLLFARKPDIYRQNPDSGTTYCVALSDTLFGVGLRISLGLGTDSIIEPGLGKHD
jgi:hypothetical protein